MRNVSARLIVHLTESRVQFQSNLKRVSVKLDVSFSQTYRQSGLGCRAIQYEPQKKACESSRVAEVMLAARNGHIVPLPFGPGRIKLTSRQRAPAKFQALPGFYRELREAHERTKRCYAPVDSFARYARYSSSWPVWRLRR